MPSLRSRQLVDKQLLLDLLLRSRYNVDQSQLLIIWLRNSIASGELIGLYNPSWDFKSATIDFLLARNQ